MKLRILIRDLIHQIQLIFLFIIVVHQRVVRRQKMKAEEHKGFHQWRTIRTRFVEEDNHLFTMQCILGEFKEIDKPGSEEKLRYRHSERTQATLTFLWTRHSAVEEVQHREYHDGVWRIARDHDRWWVQVGFALFDSNSHFHPIYRSYEQSSKSTEVRSTPWKRSNSPEDFLRIWWILHWGARLILVVQRCRPLRLLSMLRLQQLRKKLMISERWRARLTVGNIRNTTLPRPRFDDRNDSF